MTPAQIALGTGALLLTAVMWGSNHVVARALHEAVPLPAMVFWRWALALVVLVPIALPQMRKEREPLRRELAPIAVAGIVGVGIFSFLLFGGAYQSLAIEVGIINATTPAWVAVIAWLYGCSLIGQRGWTGLLFAFMGSVTIVTQGNLAALGTVDIRLGNLWSLLAAIAFAWFSLRVRAWNREISALSLTTVTALAGCLLVMTPVYLIWLASGGGAIVFDEADAARAWAGVLYIALGPTAVGNAFYLLGIARLGPQRAAAFLYLSPVFSTLLSVVLLGETLQLFHLLGFALIVVGLVLVNLDEALDKGASA
jgi:drug/metabolite transporter (DMT)-like permease